MKIAQEVVGIHILFPQSNWSDSQALLQELQTIDSAITKTRTMPQRELKSHHIESSNNMQQQAIVTDSTGKTKSLIESVQSDLNKGQELHNQKVSEVPDN